MAAPPGYSRFIEDGTIEKKAIDWIELNLEDRRLLNRAFLCQRHLPEFNLKDIREIEGMTKDKYRSIKKLLREPDTWRVSNAKEENNEEDGQDSRKLLPLQAEQECLLPLPPL